MTIIVKFKKFSTTYAEPVLGFSELYANLIREWDPIYFVKNKKCNVNLKIKLLQGLHNMKHVFIASRLSDLF